MKSSSYYYNLMTQYSIQKRNYETKKESYSNLITELKTVQISLGSPKDPLNSSYNTFKNGGYYDGGTPSRGKLTEVAGEISDAITSLETIISKTQTKIDEFTTQISEYKQKYEEAERNYYQAKKIEQG